MAGMMHFQGTFMECYKELAKTFLSDGYFYNTFLGDSIRVNNIVLEVRDNYDVAPLEAEMVKKFPRYFSRKKQIYEKYFELLKPAKELMKRKTQHKVTAASLTPEHCLLNLVIAGDYLHIYYRAQSFPIISLVDGAMICELIGDRNFTSVFFHIPRSFLRINAVPRVRDLFDTPLSKELLYSIREFRDTLAIKDGPGWEDGGRGYKRLQALNNVL